MTPETVTDQSSDARRSQNKNFNGEITPQSSSVIATDVPADSSAVL